MPRCATEILTRCTSVSRSPRQLPSTPSSLGASRCRTPRGQSQSPDGRCPQSVRRACPRLPPPRLLVVAISLTGLQRTANLLNSIGLVGISAVLVWQAFERILHPVPVPGLISFGVGIFAALGNWGVARILAPWQSRSPAIRLAYLHNVGDVYVSLAPVLAGLLVSLSGRPVFDPLAALAVAVWIMGTTALELWRSREALLWPEDARCPHSDARVA